MQLRVLGCSGGIAPGNGTTSFLVDQDLLIDAGSGLERLTHDELAEIRHIVLTHSHLDHICHLPFLLNNLIGEFDHTVHVYGLEHTINALKDHVFNNVLWPDFTQLPTVENPCVKLHTITLGKAIDLVDCHLPLPQCDRQVTPIAVAHSVPTVGYHVSDPSGSFAFSGDSSSNEGFWHALNQLPAVGALIVDNQYLQSEQAISELAKHYYAAALREDLLKLNYQPPIYLTHLPPYKKQHVLKEASQVLADWQPQALEAGTLLNLAEH